MRHRAILGLRLRVGTVQAPVFSLPRNAQDVLAVWAAGAKNVG